MSSPATINTLRASDFPNGLATKEDVDKLFQYLNPFFAQLGTLTARGVSLGQNMDGQQATFSFTAANAFSPLLVRLKDGKHPTFLIASALNVDSKAVEGTWFPTWTYLGQSPTVGNQLQINDLPGLTPGQRYTVTLFIFF